MSLFERMERKLERTVNGVFARAFRSDVQPLELAAAVRRAMDDRATLLGRGRTIVPNLFTIELAPQDFERLTEFDEELRDELIAAAQEHAEAQRYQPGGPLQVLFDQDDELETGVFRVRPATARQHVDHADPGQPRADPPSSGDDYGYGYDEYSGGWEQGGPAAPAQGPPSDAATTMHRAEPPRSAHVVQERPWLEVSGERYPLIASMTVLGRDETADVVLDDPGISRRHCEVRVTQDGPHLVSHLRDLGSTNGTFVNGEPAEAVRLTDGDEITLGRTHATFHHGRR